MAIMLDKFKSRLSGMADKVSAKAVEVNDKVAQNAKKQEGDQFLVGLDIGTEFVKALVAKVTDDGLEIVGVGRSHQGLSDMQAGAIADISAVVQNCDKALAQAEEQAGVSARTAVIGIAGELVKGTTITVRVTRKNADKPLDLIEMERIIKLVQARA
jgi:cell division protein FtsA